MEVYINRESTGQKIVLKNGHEKTCISQTRSALLIAPNKLEIGLLSPDFILHIGEIAYEVYNRGYLLKVNDNEYAFFQYGNVLYEILNSELKKELENDPKIFLEGGGIKPKILS
jgi:hypothetical protein